MPCTAIIVEKMPTRPPLTATAEAMLPSTIASEGGNRQMRHYKSARSTRTPRSPPSRRLYATVARSAAQLVTNCCRDRRLGDALGAPDLIQVAHDHGGDQGETDGDGGGQPVTAMVESVAI
jgi:hypothetical protein